MSHSTNSSSGGTGDDSYDLLSRSPAEGHPARRKSKVPLIILICVLVLAVFAAGSFFAFRALRTTVLEDIISEPSGQSDPNEPQPDPPPVPNTPELEQAPVPEPDPTLSPDETSVYPEADYPADFTVQTTDGGTFSLYEALQDHDLVLVNIFATWCPPCAYEFPFMQEAWSERSDKVAVVALSIEPSDTLDVLRNYAKEKGMTFPVGRIDGTGMEKYMEGAIPTTVLIDRTGKVAKVHVGALQSTQEFLDLFDYYTDPAYDPSVVTLEFIAYDNGWHLFEGVELSVCDDYTCTTLKTDDWGSAVFTGAPVRYHVLIIGVPEGKQVDGPSDFYVDPWSQQVEIVLK